MAARKTKKRAPSRKGSVAAKSPRRAAAKKTPSKNVNEIVHWEIQARDPGKLQAFYAKALGWKIDANNPMQYGMVSSGGADGINGGISGSPTSGSRVLVYAAVPSIPPVLAKIKSLGGKIVMPRMDVGPVVMGLYEDPEGNTMGLIEA